MTDWKSRFIQGISPHVAASNYVLECEAAVDEFIKFANANQNIWRAQAKSTARGNLTRIDIATYPRRAPAELTIMVPIAVYSDGYVMVTSPAGMGRLNDSTPEGLKGYLTDLFTGDGFQATNEDYRRRNSIDTHAWLKCISLSQVDMRDLCLIVSSSDQDRIADAFEMKSAEPIELVADLLEPIGNFKPNSASTAYRWLNSGGYILHISGDHKLVEPGRLRVVGKLEQTTAEEGE